MSLRPRFALAPLVLLSAAIVALLVALPISSQPTLATLLPQVSSTSAASYVNQPITTIESAPPIVMLNVSRDHQLFYKAYNDYSDLDNDTVAETTYKHSINYYGYFDSGKCYTYSTSTNRFEPQSLTTTKYCAGNWSGNFLNWVGMSRLDAARKLLYGGTRSTDTASTTVLERAPLPTDAHSWAKYYNGSDIGLLTPFNNLINVAPSSVSISSNSISAGTKVFRVTPGTLATISIGDQIRVEDASAPATRYMVGHVTALADESLLGILGQNVTITVPANSFVGSGENISSWRLSNLSRAGISFCNLTWAAAGNTSHAVDTASNPPLLRVAQGNFELWGANERWQCYWRGEKNDATNISGGGRNGNLAFFSGLNASNSSPSKNLHALGVGSPAGEAFSGLNNRASGEYIMRVQACVAGLIGGERCKVYPSGNRKPIGLLQVYGDDDRIRFGLATSSYQYNVSGGVLRKNVGSFRNETNEDTDGTFVAAPAGGGIVDSLNKLRMWGYRYDDGTYINGDRENCDFQLVGIATHGTTTGNREVPEGNCASWGNPTGETYLESLRYLGGLGRSADYDYTSIGSNKDTSLGLGVQSFVDPIDNTNYCANLNVLTFSASVSSYDNDQMAGLTNLRGAPDITALTNTIGAAENIHGRNWFVGRTPANPDQLCSAKVIDQLATVDGICPEASAVEGSFLIAGAALHARTKRIHADFPATGTTPAVPRAADTTSFKVTSYGIELATNTPVIRLKQPNSNKTVIIQPIYRLDRSSTGAGPFGSGAIVDFRIVSQAADGSRGRFYVNWEDSTQGGDYDQDMYGLIEYEFLSGDQIRITTDAVAAATNNGQGFGYIVSGTTQDGPHFHSGILNYDFLNESATSPVTVRDPQGRTLNGVSLAPYNRVFIDANGGCSNCTVGDPPTGVTYSLGAAAANVLQSPLYYASKYGGFVDSNGNNLPDLQSEWDSRGNDGSAGSDGVPDTYFLVSNPNALEVSLQAALNAIVAKTASGTAAAVVSNAQQGQGAVYQALYESSRTDNTGRRATWLGTLQSLFIDSQGRLREDNGDRALAENDFASDPAVEAFFDPLDRTTKLRRYLGDPANNSFSVAPLSSLKTIWNARQQLSAVTDTGTQRSFSALANTGRHILTSLDLNLNGVVDAGETQAFTPASFGATRFGVLNVSNQTDADNVVNYVRGTEIAGLRSRTIDYDNDGSTEVMRLGDIAQSTPTPVGPPAESFNILYNDRTYAAYARRYAQRRNVVYVGANDGMLHAFNGGFFDNTLKQFKLQNTTEVAHPLGAELWAYVPFNLLPHLRWLTEGNYGHVYYMDGKPRVSDVRIFNAEAACGTAAAPTPTAAGCIHPNGWGTIMVVGMRLGGGELKLPTQTVAVTKTEFSGFNPAPPAEMAFRSAYVVLDITNPEAPPTVLAELTDTTGKLGFTTGLPVVAAFTQRSVISATADTVTSVAPLPTMNDKWYLVFGNGPNVASTSSSTQPGAVFVYDLRARSYVTGYNPLVLSASPSSFVGDPAAVDWDLNFANDALYFGTVGGTAAAPTGQLYKIDTNGSSNPLTWAAPEVLLNPGGPVTSTPSVTLDESGNRWIYAGTGRFYIQGDKSSSPAQTLFGVIDTPGTVPVPAPTAKVPYANLVDTTNAVVTTAGSVLGVATPAACSAAPITNTLALGNCAVAQRGWKYRLGSGSPSERIVNRTSLFGEVLFTTAFTPSPTLCEGEGSSRLLGLDFKTGAAKATVPTFSTTTTTGTMMINGTTVGAGTTVVNASVDLGQGLAAGVALHLDNIASLNRRQVSVISQTSTAAVTNTKGNLTATVDSAEIDWRDSRRTR